MLGITYIQEASIIWNEGERTKLADNFQENGKWVGSFKTNDKVKVEKFPGRVGIVTSCFGYGEFGYWYQVHFAKDTFANVCEFELELVEE